MRTLRQVGDDIIFNSRQDGARLGRIAAQAARGLSRGSDQPPPPRDGSLKALIESERQRPWLEGYDDPATAAAALGLKGKVSARAREQHLILLEVGRRIDVEVERRWSEVKALDQTLWLEIAALKGRRRRLRAQLAASLGLLAKPLRQRLKEINERIEAADGERWRAITTRYGEVFFALLAELRPLGGTVNIETEVDDEFHVAVASAASLFPSDWLRRGRRNSLVFELGHERADFTNFGLGCARIRLCTHPARLSGTVDGGALCSPVLVHELTHWFESLNSRLGVAQWAFFERRVRGGDWERPAPRTQWFDAISNAGYRPDERGYADGFDKLYLGKVYGRGGPLQFYELLSMGIESLTRREYSGVLRDTEVRHFTLAALAVL